MNMKPILQFYAHWRDVVAKGHDSPMTGLERIIVNLFYLWLLDHYNVTPKEGQE